MGRNGLKNVFTCSPDMLGAKIGMKWVPVRALKLPTISIGIVFQGEAIGDGGKSPKPYFWGQNGPKKIHVWGLALGSFLFSFFRTEALPSHKHATKG